MGAKRVIFEVEMLCSRNVAGRRLLLALFVTLLMLPASAKVFARPTNDTLLLLEQYEDTLKTLQYEKIAPHTPDRQKLEANKRFSALLQKALELSGSFKYPFDSLTTIGRITSADRQFRLITWDVVKEDGTFNYFGFLQSLNRETNRYVVYTLQDKSAEMGNQEAVVYTPEKWLGMLYYKIFPETYQGKTIYMLLAWQGYNNIITRKIIDVVSFNKKGEAAFGMPVFKKPPPGDRSSYKRLVFRYSATAVMSLEYDGKRNRIVFDHLAPIEDELTGQYQYYAPSFQVDCLVFRGSGWEYMANIDARNQATAQDKIYTDPAKHSPDMSKSQYDYGKHPIYDPNK